MSPIIEGKIEDGVLHAALGINRLDASSSRDFKKHVEAIWSPEEVNRVELDFEKVDFIDSSGVGALLGVYKRLSGDEPNLQLSACSPQYSRSSSCFGSTEYSIFQTSNWLANSAHRPSAWSSDLAGMP